MNVYCDNAATTAIDRDVLEAMMPFLTRYYGNPSSGHFYGQAVREAIYKARESVALHLNTEPSQIFFTSGATEALNITLSGVIESYGIQHIITSPIEHKAILETLTQLGKSNKLTVSLVNLDEKGNIDFNHLERLLRFPLKGLVSLMHANNEIGNLNDLHHIGALCQAFKALFLSDTTQTIGKIPFDLQTLPVDFVVGSAHKFHGPKGVGFTYIRETHGFKSLVYGGGQEKGVRPGTENTVGIVGLAKALEIAYRDLKVNQKHITLIKNRLLSRLTSAVSGEVRFNGESDSNDKSLYNILNVAFPNVHSAESLVSQLNLYGIAVSGGSACSNLNHSHSHVLTALQSNLELENVRFSFSKFNTPADVDYILQSLKNIYHSDRQVYVGRQQSIPVQC
ncbi:cysteine desulfurase family protein [Runella sp.]|uniref:cysteine desulfurase family protein n=1 Tax=Runella sp. TaxID=1960881 RepID=UPI003D13A1D3